VRVDRTHERHAAGPHGELLAQRLSDVLPQLQEMVMARTRHIDETLSGIAGLRQVVILGAGLDMRPFRLFQTLNRPTFFELDLPEMLEERTRVISQLKDRPVVSRRMVATDFKRDDVADLLLKHPDFDPSLPTGVIYEGCSMYFGAEENRVLMLAISRMMQHHDSRLWSDWVTESVVNGTTQNEGIAKFIDGMEELGERFNFGCDAPQEFLRCGFSETLITSVQAYIGSDDPAMATYQFGVSAK
jgi:methyltransferase (TIGR00027 family)